MSRWLAWHVYQHDRQDELLAEAVAPLLQQLRDSRLITEAFVLRYWDGGPHVRIRVRPRSDQAAADVRRLLSNRLEHWCSRHPSHRPMSAAAYELLRTSLGDPEAEPVLHEDGTILETHYLPEHHRYGHGEALEACERHFDASTGLALSVLRAGASQRIRASIVAMTVFGLIEGLSAPSRRTWASEVAAASTAAAVPSLSGDRLRAMAREQTPIVAELGESLAVLDGALRRSGDDYLPPTQGFGGIRFAAEPADRTAHTLDLCAHLFANRIGVRLPDEVLIRTAVARAILADEADPAEVSA